jgi:hypothetical protein
MQYQIETSGCDNDRILVDFVPVLRKKVVYSSYPPPKCQVARPDPPEFRIDFEYGQ